MPYSTAEAKQEFDRWSSRYDRGILQRLFFEPSHALMLEEMGPEQSRILDIGCGTGIFATQLLDRFPQSQVWGLDLSDGMLRQARERCRNAPGRLHLVQGDSERLPFASDTFDAVTCTHSFHHYPRQRRVLAEMHRVLRPGGRLLVIDGDRDGLWGRLIFDVIVVLMEGAVHHLSGRAFRQTYEEAGFANITQRRQGRFLPVLLTVGQAVKPALPARRVA